jgi:hypothetical protein
MEGHRRTVRSSVIEMLLLSKSPTPIGMPDDNRSILSLAGSTSFDPKAVISHMFIPDLNAGHRDSEMSVQASPSRDAKNIRNGKLGLPSQTENPISAETNVPACE